MTFDCAEVVVVVGVVSKDDVMRGGGVSIADVMCAGGGGSKI